MEIQYYTYNPVSIDALQAVHRVVWWLRPMRWLLERYGYEIGRWNPVTTYETITYKPRDIIDLVRQQVMDIHRHTGKRPRVVILGREQQMELFEAVAEFPMIIEPMAPLSQTDSIFGLTIILHPLIDGVVVVPQE